MARKPDIMLSLNRKAITDPLDIIAARGYGFSRVFDDFLSLSCHALAKQERDYMEIIRRYPNDRTVGSREADQFRDAFHAWQKALKLEYRDYLGEIYEHRVSLGENEQFFTPEPVCEMMVAMTAGTLKDGQRTSDPACGSGRTLLALTRKNRLAYFHGIDLDLRCVKMTALNLLCRNVDATVVWGNSLTLKAFGGYELKRTFMGGSMEWFGENRAAELIRMGLVEAPTEPAPAVGEPVKREPVVVPERQYSLGI